MRFDTGLKVAALCAVTLASNFVLAAEVRVTNKAGKARVHQAKRAIPQPSLVTESMVDEPRAIEPSVVGEPEFKQESIPIEKLSPRLELKGVRG
ncbi:MAG: hypothetical protein FD121_918 [Gallionellaceae bacterium]|nr:MAG: hypothetical protein FD121_918 [Gallionellaceae bacterium]